MQDQWMIIVLDLYEARIPTQSFLKVFIPFRQEQALIFVWSYLG